MTLSGSVVPELQIFQFRVLIPLLLDDPLWDNANGGKSGGCYVLIPLLLDDPLWASTGSPRILAKLGLNPSFAG